MSGGEKRRGPRVAALAPMPPEPQAYALARYSRSADPFEQSLEWVHEHSSEKFWERFYFDYGHASIADLGHVAVCIEEVSELAAIELIDEQTWDGQAKSTRYQDFSAVEIAVPAEIEDERVRERFSEAGRRLLASYHEVHRLALEALRNLHPRPRGMGEAVYERTLAARAFDVARYLLPLGTPTSLGQVVSIRTLEKQISRLMVSDYAECRHLAGLLTEMCAREPDSTWNRLRGTAEEPAQVAPTLARHARENAYLKSVRDASREVADRALASVHATGGPDVHLIRPHDTETELAATLLYAGSNLPYAKILGRMENSSPDERAWVIEQILADRGPHDELPRAARTGYRFIFDITMDVGGWRDMHRHRRCTQILQSPDLIAGPQFPDEAETLGVVNPLEEAYGEALEAARWVEEEAGSKAAHYLLPFAHRIRCLFKMDFGEADYICRLRSSVKGHPSYRKVAWEMAEAIKVAEPALAPLVHATPPWEQDPLKR